MTCFFFLEENRGAHILIIHRDWLAAGINVYFWAATNSPNMRFQNSNMALIEFLFSYLWEGPMDLTPELKAQIDEKSYESLLSHWRHAPIGDQIFQGESGEYWGKRMQELRSQPGGDDRHIAASKSIGWD